MIKNVIKFLCPLVILLFLSEFSYAQFEQLYDVVPDVPNCKTGTLKQSEKDKMLEYFNKVRNVHGLPALEYDESHQKNAMEISLISAANENLIHEPDINWKCYSEDGLEGGKSSNLFIGFTPSNQVMPSEQSVISWMNDENQIELGHRRWIIDPFVKKIAFGRVDGKSKTNNFNVTAMTHYYDSQTLANLSSMTNDFVACPYGDYPPTLWDFGWSVLSFTVVANKSSRSANNSNLISYASTLNGQPVNAAYVEVEDEEGNITTFSGTNGKLGWDYEGYGVPNYCYWQMQGLQQQKLYKVRVFDVLVNGQHKNYSYEFRFRDPFITKPSAPLLSEPANNAVDINPNVTLKWGSSQGATYYVLQVSKTNDFAPANLLVNNETISGTNYQVSGVLEPMTKYYWRVAAKNDAGTGSWSPTWNFTTTTAPDAPTLAGPANNSTNVSLTPTLTWNTADKADQYQVQVSDASNFQVLLVDKNNITQTSYTVESDVLSTMTKYFWRVRSISNISGPSTWTEVRNFTTAEAAPAKPELLSPAQGATGQSATLVLVWSSVPSAESYDLMISSSNLYEEWNTVLDQKGITKTNFKVPLGTLELETQYFWRVRSNGPGGTSEWSKNGRFKVGDASPVEDMKYTPANITIYPNPITDEAGIFLTVIEKASIKLCILNIMGEKVATIVNTELIPGDYILNYDCSALPNGVYYYQMTTANVNITGKINIIK